MPEKPKVPWYRWQFRLGAWLLIGIGIGIVSAAIRQWFIAGSVQSSVGMLCVVGFWGAIAISLILCEWRHRVPGAGLRLEFRRDRIESGNQPSVADDEMFVTLIRVAQEDKEIRAQ